MHAMTGFVYSSVRAVIQASASKLLQSMVEVKGLLRVSLGMFHTVPWQLQSFELPATQCSFVHR